MSKSKVHYIIMASRWGDVDSHTYAVGLYDNFELACTTADEHTKYRGGKYMCQVLQCKMNSLLDTDYCATILYQTKTSFDEDTDAVGFSKFLHKVVDK